MGGSGAAQLALAILANYTGNDRFAEHYHQTFKETFIATITVDDWRINGLDIKKFIELCKKDEE